MCFSSNFVLFVLKFLSIFCGFNFIKILHFRLQASLVPPWTMNRSHLEVVTFWSEWCLLVFSSSAFALFSPHYFSCVASYACNRSEPSTTLQAWPWQQIDQRVGNESSQERGGLEWKLFAIVPIWIEIETFYLNQVTSLKTLQCTLTNES